MKKAKNRYLVAVVPSKQVDLFEVVEHVLVNPAIDLEKGYEASFSGSTNPSGLDHFIGSIFSIQGDHKGQAEIAGLREASAVHGSRYSTCEKRDYWKSPNDLRKEGKPSLKRNSEESHDIIEEQLEILGRPTRGLAVGSKSRARNILKNNGFAEKVWQSATENLLDTHNYSI